MLLVSQAVQVVDPGPLGCKVDLAESAVDPIRAALAEEVGGQIVDHEHSVALGSHHLVPQPASS